MSAFIKFNKGLLKSPTHVQVWLLFLMTSNLVLPLFFLHRLEAQLVLVASLAGAILMTILTGVYGFNRLVGLGHIFWIPLLLFLWTRLGQIPADSFYGLWLRIVMALDGVSLVIDAIDVFRYVAGDREETVKGL